MTTTQEFTVYDTQRAVAHFGARITFETDAADVFAAFQAGRVGFTLVDVRGPDAWDAGHLPGAIHLPLGKLRLRADEVIPHDRPVVVYCWGPGCNGATKGALELARQGYEVREMLGGFEYWAREGNPYVNAVGEVRHDPDPLVAPPHQHS